MVVTESIKTRLDFVDLAKGIGMLMVIYLHITINYPDTDNIYRVSHWDSFVHSMFMPLFFLLSGLFFSAKLPFKIWIKKRSKRLLLPFCMFYLLTYLINVVLTTFLNVKLKSGFSYSDIFVVFYKDVYPNSAIWFLLALFWSSIILFVILRVTSKIHLQILGTLLFFIVGVVLDKKSINIPLYIDTAFTATIFLYTGYLFKHYQLIANFQSLAPVKQRIWTPLIFFVSFTICWLWGEGVSMVNNSTGNPVLFYITAMAGSIAVLAFSYIFNRLPIVSYVGRYSMLVLCTHMYLTNAFTRIVIRYDFPFLVSSILVLVIICCCYYVIVPILKKSTYIQDVLL